MIRLAHPPGYAEERRYVVDVVLGELLGLEAECVAETRDDVELTLRGHAGSLRLEDGLFAVPPEDWLTERALPAEPLPRDGDLPLLYGGDLLGGAFFLLTRYEEVVSPARDEHGRFAAVSSLAYRERFLERPLVDEYAQRLLQRLRAVWPGLEGRPRDARLVPSHDVDVPFCGRPPLAQRLRSAGGDLAVRRDAVLAARRLAARTDLCDTFDLLMEESERAGVHSTFYVMAAHGPEDRIPGYSLDDARVRALLRRIHERGHRLGLHASYASRDEPERIADELTTLQEACARSGVEQEAWGVRQHYLRWSPELWAVYDEAGLSYDTSVGFADAPGFRAGIAREYPVFDLRRGRGLAVRERPLVAMEASVLQYLGLAHDDALEHLSSLKERCRVHGGDFTLLWHNNRLESRRDRRLYRAVLAA